MANVFKLMFAVIAAAVDIAVMNHDAVTNAAVDVDLFCHVLGEGEYSKDNNNQYTVY